MIYRWCYCYFPVNFGMLGKYLLMVLSILIFIAIILIVHFVLLCGSTLVKKLLAGGFRGNCGFECFLVLLDLGYGLLWNLHCESVDLSFRPELRPLPSSRSSSKKWNDPYYSSSIFPQFSHTPWLWHSACYIRYLIFLRLTSVCRFMPAYYPGQYSAIHDSYSHMIELVYVPCI